MAVHGFRFCFTPLAGVLFAFPSRYFFAIGGRRVFSLGSWSTRIQAGFLVPRPTQEPHHGGGARCAYGAVTLCGGALRLLPLRVPLSFPPRVIPMRPYNPAQRRFGLLPFRSPLLRESLLISSPALLRWFTSRGVAPPDYFIHPRGACLPACGLPHSATPGSRDVCSSPGLFAACRGLHRLAAPRHPPWTFSRLAILPLPLYYLLVSFSFPGSFKQLFFFVLGQNRVELLTPALSERCSNQLSYCPVRRHSGSSRQGKKNSMKKMRTPRRTLAASLLLERR